MALFCYGQKGNNDTTRIVLQNDSIEYELIVLDPGYSSFLATAKPIEFYSNAYYRLWNNRYVTEWNYRSSDPLRFGDIYSNHIFYEINVDYGIEVNYQLYNYFLFFERKYGVKLIQRAGY